MATGKITKLDEVEVQPVPLAEGHHGGSIQYVFTRDSVGSERLRFIVQTYPAGGFTVAEEHGVHERMEQAYFVLEGEMEVTVGDETRTIGPGGCVFIPRGVRHEHRNPGDTPLRFLTLNCRWDDQ